MKQPQQTSLRVKPPSKRHQPKGLSILYEDQDILVVDKACGLLTISSEKERDNTAYFLLTNYVRKGNSKSRNRIFIVHRLDRETSGVIVFAKHELAKQFLQDNWKDVKKTYTALVEGSPKEEQGIIASYLTENGIHKMISTRDEKNGKFAKTGYKVIKHMKHLSLLEIQLYTGRKHQIRVHLAESGCPIVGDRKYGNRQVGSKRMGLHATTLTFPHPRTREPMTFTAKLPPYFASLARTHT